MYPIGPSYCWMVKQLKQLLNPIKQLLVGGLEHFLFFHMGISSYNESTGARLFLNCLQRQTRWTLESTMPLGTEHTIPFTHYKIAIWLVVDLAL